MAPPLAGEAAEPIKPAETGEHKEEQQGAANALRDALDLRAQERMAHWALVAAVLIGVTVWLLYETLLAARTANQGFAAASQQQLTAYVVAEAFQLHVRFFEHDMLTIEWSFALRNAGGTPAFDVTHDWKCDMGTKEEALAWPLKLPEAGGVMGPGRAQEFSGRLEDKKNGRPMFSGLDFTVHAAMYETVWIRGVASYRDISNRLWRHEYMWELSQPTRNILPLQPRPNVLTIQLTPHTSGNSLRVVEDPNEK